MRRRHPLPRLWMMTDERQGERLLPALRRLPPGSGVVFRHYGLDPSERRSLFERVKRIARSRRLMLFLGGPVGQARNWGADGSHGPMGRSAAVHSLAEIRAAERAGADFLFLSPVFPTRSHPGDAALSPRRFNLLAGSTRLPVIALGGMSRVRARLVRSHGWAAIDALTPSRLRRKAVAGTAP